MRLAHAYSLAMPRPLLPPLRRTSWLAGLLAVMLLLHGCGATTATTPDEKKSQEASGQAVLSDLEPRLAAWRALPPEQREERGRAFGPEFESDLKALTGSSAQNKLLLWLADWRWQYAGGVGVDECLDRLEASKFPQVKAWGQRMRVLWMLRNGDIRQARPTAQDLVNRIPEFQPLLNLVALHETIGHAPPRTAGQNLTGGPMDPAAGRSARYLVYIFIDVLNRETLYVLRQWLLEAMNPGYQEQLRVVLVTSESPPLAIEGKIRELPGLSYLDVLWAPPAGTAGEAPGADWTSAWRLSPNQLVQVVLGPPPARLILAVPFEPQELRVLLPPPAAAH